MFISYDNVIILLNLQALSRKKGYKNCKYFINTINDEEFETKFLCQY